MILYTAHSKNRANLAKIDKKLLLVDIGPLSVLTPFCPSKELYFGLLRSTITEETFIEEYRHQLEKSMSVFKRDWLQMCNVEKLLIMDNVKTSDLATPRWILREYLARFCHEKNIPFKYRGEVTGPNTLLQETDICLSATGNGKITEKTIQSVVFGKHEKHLSYVDKPKGAGW